MLRTFILYLMLVLSRDHCRCLELDIKVDLPVQGGAMEYIYYNEKITWNEAAIFCEDTGGSLAKIDSADFHHRLVNAFEASFGSSSFPDDYWTGVFQPSEGNIRWASDCSNAYFTSNLNTEWDSNKRCFKFNKDQHTGDREPCSSKTTFICEKPLTPDYSCNMSEIFSANSLGTHNLDVDACEEACHADSDCWMVIFTPPYGCVKIDYNTATPAVGVQAANSPITMKGKFCIEVSLNTGVVTPHTADSSDTPEIICTVPDIIPAAVYTVLPPPLTPTPSYVCTTETVTQLSLSTPVYECTTETMLSLVTSFSSCATETLTENMYHTLSCTPEHLTLTSTPLCSPEISTISPAPTCMTSTCLCSQTVSTVLLSTFSCSDIAPTLSVIAPATSLNAEKLAKEISQNLTIDGKSTSAYQRKLVSARDDRVLSKTMGYFGLCFVLIPFFVIVAFDIKMMVSHFLRQQTYQAESNILRTRRCRINKY